MKMAKTLLALLLVLALITVSCAPAEEVSKVQEPTEEVITENVNEIDSLQDDLDASELDSLDEDLSEVTW